jgi:hypothetical protein
VLVLLLLVQTKPEDLPAVREIAGDLRIWRAKTNETREIDKEVRVDYGDRIGTPNGEYACLSIAGGEEVVSLKGVRVGKDRGLAFERSGTNLLIKVYDGRVTVDAFQTEVVLETPTGTVKAKKSYFYVEVDGENTKVVAIEGTLTFATSLGTVEVPPGQESTATRGKKPTEPKPADVGRSLRDLSGAPANLVQNGGFEFDLKQWTTRFGNPDNKYATVDRSVVLTGAKSVSLELTPRIFRGVRDGALLEQEFPVTRGKRYLARAYLRPKIAKGKINVGLSVVGVVEGTEYDSIWHWPELRDDAWCLARVVVTAKSDKMGVAVSVQIRSDDFDGRCWVDDLVVMELPDLPRKPR